jgi:hypothetical protein
MEDDREYRDEGDWITAVNHLSLGGLQCVTAQMLGQWSVGLVVSTNTGEPVSVERLTMLQELLMARKPAGVVLALRSVD